MKFKNGVNSLSCCYALSTPLLAINRTPFSEKNVCIKPYAQIVASKPGHILDNQGGYVSVFNFINKFVPR